MTSFPGDSDEVFHHRGDSAPPSGPKWTPPTWIMSLGKTLAVAAMSAIVGVMSATWKVRGMYDDVAGRQDMQDLKSEQLNKSIDSLRQDIRDLRRDLSNERR